MLVGDSGVEGVKNNGKMMPNMCMHNEAVVSNSVFIALIISFLFNEA